MLEQHGGQEQVRELETEADSREQPDRMATSQHLAHQYTQRLHLCLVNIGYNMVPEMLLTRKKLAAGV